MMVGLSRRVPVTYDEAIFDDAARITYRVLSGDPPD